ncbi:ABC transporter ATP-binding protein [Amycolatopsis jejuensis]|uniref:ABC transporter ATP-binding protein n=1 Tax=Amycolatopsis jejuensis TaxID=330084 RepID=UPI001FDF4957|nr:ABC transporter ATP-binding protein [Amycolatopsis jejuensis]
MIEVCGVSKAFPAGDGAREVISGLDLTISAGEFVSIVGPSGCGKSTLVSMMAGLTEASGGTILVRGEQVRGLVPEIGFAFQRDALLPWRTAEQNVALPLRCRGIRKADALGRARTWLERVGLGQHFGKYPHQLSGGMRKRVAIAVMLAYEPDILLLDEPFSALDVQTRSLMENDLLALCADGGQSVVLITHDLEEAIVMSDRVVVMSAGPARVIGDHRIELTGPRDVFESKSDPNFAGLYSKIWNDLRAEVQAAGQRELAGR